MIKKLKIFSIVGMVLILLCFTTNVFAVDMNITETNTLNTSNSSNTSNTTNTSNTSNTTNARNTSNTTTSTNTSSTTSSSPNNTNSITVQGGLPESDLGISNILSIILIAIGVLLILLAIAILIRLGK